MGEHFKGLNMYKQLVVTTATGGKKHSTGNTVITKHGVRWCYTYQGVTIVSQLWLKNFLKRKDINKVEFIYLGLYADSMQHL